MDSVTLSNESTKRLEQLMGMFDRGEIDRDDVLFELGRLYGNVNPKTQGFINRWRERQKDDGR